MTGLTLAIHVTVIQLMSLKVLIGEHSLISSADSSKYNSYSHFYYSASLETSEVKSRKAGGVQMENNRSRIRLHNAGVSTEILRYAEFDAFTRSACSGSACIGILSCPSLCTG